MRYRPISIGEKFAMACWARAHELWFSPAADLKDAWWEHRRRMLGKARSQRHYATHKTRLNAKRRETYDPARRHDAYIRTSSRPEDYLGPWVPAK